jgi:LPS export ABC transporter protein LptC
MTFGQIRFIKWSLFAVLIGFGGYVAVTVWRGVADNAGPLVFPQANSDSLVSREVEIEQLDSDGNTAWSLKAAESIRGSESSQEFRDVEIHFSAGEEQKPVVVTADYCRINKDSSVHLEGNVIVRDATSLRLESDSLDFRRYPDLVWSTDPVRYFKEGLVGDAEYFRYFTKRGDLELGEGVSMVFQEASEEPVRVRSISALIRKNQNWVQFVDEVRVRQGSRALDCNDLKLFLIDGTEEVERIEAREQVDLRLYVPADAADGEPGDGTTGPSVFSREPGLKRLLTDRLEMLYRPGGRLLDRVRALEGGRLVIRLPDDAGKGYHKELEGYTLAFDFDNEGRLSMLRGRGGVTLVLTPVGAGEEKKVTARQLEADFDPESGEMLEARCQRSVEFEQGDVRATAEEGTFLAMDSKLVLRKTPRLWDARTNLEADEIRIAVDSGNVEGLGNVRSTSAAGEKSGMFPTIDSSPVHFVGQHLDYDRANDLAIYDGGARAFQGRNRIEANRIRIEQTKGVLHAEGDVTTIFLQKLTGKTKKEEPTETRAEALLYRSDSGVLEYRREVVMRSPEMRLRGKCVDVILETGGSEVREILATTDVEIETAEGKAGGDYARYLPKADSVTMMGADAWLENAGKLTKGKQLTFFLADDRILVNGQEQTRTKTTYSSNPHPFF